MQSELCLHCLVLHCLVGPSDSAWAKVDPCSCSVSQPPKVRTRLIIAISIPHFVYIWMLFFTAAGVHLPQWNYARKEYLLLLWDLRIFSCREKLAVLFCFVSLYPNASLSALRQRGYVYCHLCEGFHREAWCHDLWLCSFQISRQSVSWRRPRPDCGFGFVFHVNMSWGSYHVECVYVPYTRNFWFWLFLRGYVQQKPKMSMVWWFMPGQGLRWLCFWIKQFPYFFRKNHEAIRNLLIKMPVWRDLAQIICTDHRHTDRIRICFKIVVDLLPSKENSPRGVAAGTRVKRTCDGSQMTSLFFWRSCSMLQSWKSGARIVEAQTSEEEERSFAASPASQVRWLMRWILLSLSKPWTLNGRGVNWRSQHLTAPL